MNTPQPGEIYTHYKHPDYEYEIIACGTHTENNEELVAYKALYKTDDYPLGKVWIRPVSMFMEKVTIDGKEVKRFTKK